jgi:hypothetical protein
LSHKFVERARSHAIGEGTRAGGGLIVVRDGGEETHRAFGNFEIG